MTHGTRIKWDKYETSLLIDAFWKIEEKPTSKKEIIEQLSSSLRTRAKNQGIIIDDFFRNINGINMQLAPIGHSFFPNRPSLSSSAVFDEMTELYKNDRKSFDLILEEAKKQIASDSYSKHESEIDTNNNSIFQKTISEIDDCFKNVYQTGSQVLVKDENLETDSISFILNRNFKYGFKTDSIIDLIKFRQFAEKDNIALPESDDELKKSIINICTIIGNKAFYKDDRFSQELRTIICNIFSSEIEVIYYQSLFEIEQEWMNLNSVFTSEMLKEFLQVFVPQYYYSKQFVCKNQKYTEKEAVSKEIIRVWGENKTEEVSSLKQKLPYIPIENIWRVISGNDQFVLSSEGEYLYIEKFVISQNEILAVLNFVEKTCKEIGFCPLTDLPLGDIEENNYELSKTTIYNAIYKTALIDKYYLNGKILTQDRSDIDAVSLLKESIKGKSECIFDDVAEEIIELTGSSNRQYAFQALYDSMIRIDKNHYVSDDSVNFDIDEIDKVISSFVNDHFIAIREITTFAMFPICGQNWNHYLLESYCHRFSHKYSLKVINYNDKNAGIIVERGYAKDYYEMLAIEAARSGVELESQTIGAYFFSTGFLAKRTYANLDVIIEQARLIRKGGQ